MENKTMLQKIRSVKLCLMAHPDNEPNSEFQDRISDLEEIENDLKLKSIKLNSEMYHAIVDTFPKLNEVKEKKPCEHAYNYIMKGNDIRPTQCLKCGKALN